MTTIAGTFTDAPYARPASARGLLQRAMDAVARTWQRQRTQRALAQLSDHTLKDIGLRRCEIDSIAELLASGGWDSTRIPRAHVNSRV